MDGTGGITGTAEFRGPGAVAIDHLGNLFVADTGNDSIRKVDAVGSVSTFAGDGDNGYIDGQNAQFFDPGGLAIDLQGNLIVADTGNRRIRRVTPSGVTSTVAGNGTYGSNDGIGGPNGDAAFKAPLGVAVDLDGEIYVADGNDNRIRKIDLAGNVTTVAGDGMAGYHDGPALGADGAEFDGPSGLAIDGAGDLFIAEAGNRIRKISLDGGVSTVAGNGVAGFIDGPAAEAEFDGPAGVVVDSMGILIVSDGRNNRIRMVDPFGNVTTLAGNGTWAWADGTGGRCGTAEFQGPGGIGLDDAENVIVPDTSDNRLRRVLR